MASNVHSIRQQYLQFVLNGAGSEGLALQGRLSDWYQHWLLPALTRTLDRCAPPTGSLYIERLVIDVGTLSLARLEQDWAETIAQAIETQLRALAQPDTLTPMMDDSYVQHKTAQQSLQEAFLYFLQTGRLPWSFRLPAGEFLEQALLKSWQEGERSALNLRAIKAAMLPALTSARVRKRLIYQFSPTFRTALLEQLAPEINPVMEAIMLALQQADVLSSEVKLFTHQLWETALAALATGQSPTANRLVGEAWQGLPQTVATTYTSLSGVLAQHWPEAIQPSAGAQEPANPATRTDSHAEKKLAHFPPATERSIVPLLSSAAPDNVREGIYIDCAGLVLLHPFLPHFFAALGIAAEDKLLQPERALCLLHFLATGQTVAPEYELTLPKILCNVPLETPVAANVNLTAAEQEEATALLSAVIRHWEALGSTSADGLRGTFLVRPGKVSLRADGDWRLQVEAQSFDLLLEALPWGISTIQLPWMKTMLWVEWRE